MMTVDAEFQRFCYYSDLNSFVEVVSDVYEWENSIY